jgi:hypothetical protein
LRRQIIFFRAAFSLILLCKINEKAALKNINFAAVGGKILFTQPIIPLKLRFRRF